MVEYIGMKNTQQTAPATQPVSQPDLFAEHWYSLNDRPPLRRARDGVFFGVCTGVARHLGIHPIIVQVVVFLAAVFGGIGFLFYLWLWIAVPLETPQEANAIRLAAPLTVPQPRASKVRRVLLILLVGMALLVGSAVSLASGVEPVFLAFMFALTAFGVVLIWSQVSGGQIDGIRAWVLLLVGAFIVLIAIIFLFDFIGNRVGGGFSVPALLLVAVIMLVVFLPVLLKMYRDLGDTRVAAARQAERADIAAHLHDSVLQTLTVIRNRADDAEFVERVARAQERDLRAWLYGDAASRRGQAGTTFTADGALQDTQAAVKTLIAELEDVFDTDFSLVIVGRQGCAGNTEALLGIVREACTNAVKHGAPPFSVYFELGEETLDVYVRDRGIGFDMDEIGEDRHGVRESIVGRAERLGGSAEIRGGGEENGTEVHVQIPAGGYTAATY